MWYSLIFKRISTTVPHQELLFKLWRIGITGQLWFWFREYLSCRTHMVKFDNQLSSSLPVLLGVPQGSILGPLLFLIYIDDIPAGIHHSLVSIYTDDTKLLKPISSVTDELQLQSDLRSLDSWCDSWCLRLSPSKCFSLRLSLSHPLISSMVLLSLFREIWVWIHLLFYPGPATSLPNVGLPIWH